MPQAIIRLTSTGIRQGAAAKLRNQARLRERRLASATVRNNRDKRVLLELADQFIDFVVATEEAIRVLLGHGLQADERRIEHHRDMTGRAAQHRGEKLHKFVRIIERIVHRLVLAGKGRQRRIL